MFEFINKILNHTRLDLLLLIQIHMNIIKYSNAIRSHNHLVWLNGWVFAHELGGCGFESRCCHLKFRYGTCFEQEVPLHSGNYRVYVHSEARKWHDNNIVFYNQLRYPFMINLDSCNVSCNTVDDLSRRICVPNKTTDVNLMHLIW